MIEERAQAATAQADGAAGSDPVCRDREVQRGSRDRRVAIVEVPELVAEDRSEHGKAQQVEEGIDVRLGGGRLIWGRGDRLRRTRRRFGRCGCRAFEGRLRDDLEDEREEAAA